MTLQNGRPVLAGATSGGQRLEFSRSSHGVGWIVSYADMMTIILTFFIMLLSISRIPTSNFEMMVEALTGRQVGNLRQVRERIDEVIAREGLAGEVVTEVDEFGLRIEFANALLFASGEVTLTPRAQEIFEPIGHHLVTDLEPEYGITVEGYTDDVPIHTERYASNWELSTSRATHVMRRLAQAGLDPLRMSVHGFADTRDALEQDLHDPEAMAALSPVEIARVRAANRRVVIRIDRLTTGVLKKIERQQELREAGRTADGHGNSGVVPGAPMMPVSPLQHAGEQP